jgi:urease accessory protein
MKLTPHDALRLFQIADSALPVGAAAHSFGLETLAADGAIAPPALAAFLRDYVAEAGLADAVLCREGHRLAGNARDFESEWIALCALAAALKPARESREAGAVLGRRLLRLVAVLEPLPTIERALDAAEAERAGVQYAPAFGLAAGALGVDADLAALALLQQTVMGLVSACQRAMPVGQTHASRVHWDLHDAIAQVAAESARTHPDAIACFVPMVELASMRHPRLGTRLFVS